MKENYETKDGKENEKKKKKRKNGKINSCLAFSSVCYPQDACKVIRQGREQKASRWLP